MRPQICASFLSPYSRAWRAVLPWETWGKAGGGGAAVGDCRHVSTIGACVGGVLACTGCYIELIMSWRVCGGCWPARAAKLSSS